MNDTNDFWCLLIATDILEIEFSRVHRVGIEDGFLEYRKFALFLISV